MKNELTNALQQTISAAVVIGNLPERPGYNGSILQIDDEEAERIASDLTSATNTLEKAQALFDAKDAEIARLKSELARPESLVVSVMRAEIATLKTELAHVRRVAAFADARYLRINELRAAKDAEIAALRKDTWRLDWLANNPVEALDIFGHTRPGEAREVRIDIDAAIAQAVQPENQTEGNQ